jgi:hypothetical protein
LLLLLRRGGRNAGSRSILSPKNQNAYGASGTEAFSAVYSREEIEQREDSSYECGSSSGGEESTLSLRCVGRRNDGRSEAHQRERGDDEITVETFCCTIARSA